MNLDENLKYYFDLVGNFFKGPWYSTVQQYLLDKLDEESKRVLLSFDNAPKDLWVIGHICTEAIEASDFNNNYIRIETDVDQLNSFIHKTCNDREAIKLYYDAVPRDIAAR